MRSTIDFAKNFYGPCIMGPGTLAQIASAPETWEELLSFHHLLASDEYVQYLDTYYREGFRRFGSRWWYLDIVNVLFAASKSIQPRRYLEIGVRRGRSATVVARGNPSVHIVGFDMWMQGYAGMENPGKDFVAKELARHGHAGKLEFIDGNSQETVPRYFAGNPGVEFDLITVDGDHSEDGAYRDLMNVLPRLSIGGVVVFDDIAHPQHAYLLEVWQRVKVNFPWLSTVEYAELGFGVAFGMRRF